MLKPRILSNTKTLLSSLYNKTEIPNLTHINDTTGIAAFRGAGRGPTYEQQVLIRQEKIRELL